MGLSGFALGFTKGWSLALPMLMLGPIIMFGMFRIISGMTEKYVK